MSIVNHSVKRLPPEIAKVSPKKQAVTNESVDPHSPTPIDTKKDTGAIVSSQKKTNDANTRVADYQATKPQNSLSENNYNSFSFQGAPFQSIPPTPPAVGTTPYPYNSQLSQLDAQQMTQSYSGNPQYLQMLPVVNQGFGTESNLNRYPLTPSSFPMVSPQSPFFFMNATQTVDHHEMSDPYVAIPVPQQTLPAVSPFISTSTSP